MVNELFQQAKRIAQRLPHRELLNLIFPPRCVGCETYLFDEFPLLGKSPDRFASDPISLLQKQTWCDRCLDAVRAPLSDRCPTCGAITAVHRSYHGRCRLCYQSKFHFHQAICINNYAGLMQQLVIRMKGQRDEPLAMQFGDLLGYELERIDDLKDVDLLVPVPTHWLKKFRKGFQASELICQKASSLSQIPARNRLLRATRKTEKQGMLSEAQRRNNVNGAFEVTPFYRKRIRDLHIVLIDDVMTSGATVNQCASVLLDAGARRIDVAVIARGAKAQ